MREIAAGFLALPEPFERSKRFGDGAGHGSGARLQRQGNLP